MKRMILLAPILATAGCGMGSDVGGGDGHTPGGDPAVAPLNDGCAKIFEQDQIPDYYFTIDDGEWSKLQDEFVHVVEREEQMLDTEPYHPVGLQVQQKGQMSDPIPGVLLRLNGNTSWKLALQYDDNPKMQFVVAFNEVDKNGRFEGLRKVQLDMPRYDRTFLEQRVSLSYLREAGTGAPCANNARVYINGQYYGIYTNLERQDKEWLERVFPENPEGDLWKGGRFIKTNDDTFTWDHLSAFWDSETYDQMVPLIDMDRSIHEWAAEAVVGDSDGYYNGHANWMLYDHPDTGKFIWLPNDLDTAMDFDFLPADRTPVFPQEMWRWERDWHHYQVIIGDDRGLNDYVDALRDQLAKYDVGAMEQRIADYREQIEVAAADDPHRPFTMDDHAFSVDRMAQYPAARYEYLTQWLDCWDHGGSDGDGDGFDMCHDCNDGDRAVNADATEVCDMQDNDCDGHLDNIAGEPVCSE